MRTLRRLAWVAMLTVRAGYRLGRARGFERRDDRGELGGGCASADERDGGSPEPDAPHSRARGRARAPGAAVGESGRDAGIWRAAGRGFPGARRTDLGAGRRTRHRWGKPRARPRGGEHRCARPGEGRPRPTHGGAGRRLRPAVLGCRRTGSARGRGHGGGRRAPIRSSSRSSSTSGSSSRRRASRRWWRRAPCPRRPGRPCRRPRCRRPMFRRRRSRRRGRPASVHRARAGALVPPAR